MSNINDKDFEVYKRVFMISSSVMLILLQIFVILVSNGIDVANFPFIKNSMIRVILQFSIQIVFFSLISVIVYHIVLKIEEALWINSHRAYWLQGIWLHIHEKPNVRVGVVDIKQKFYYLEVHGENIRPNLTRVTEIRRTNWDYIDTKFDLTKHIEFVGNYTAMKYNSDDPNYGAHIFNNVDKDKDGWPIAMYGKFGDIFKINLENIDKTDKAGGIYFFKLNDKIKKYIESDNRIDYMKLSNILSIDELKDEPYVC